MSLAEIVILTLKLSLMVLVFNLGLGARPHQFTHLLRHPGQLIRSLVSMNLVILALAVAIAMLFPLDPNVKLVLIALALSPLPPVLPKKLLKAGGGEDYVTALLFTAAVFSIVWIPLAGKALDMMFPADINLPPAPIAKLVLMTLLAPAMVGLVVRLAAPKVADRIEGPLAKGATLVLLAGLALLIVKAAPAMLGLGTLLAIVAFLVLALAAGHLLGGPTPGDRSVLALASASRHPGVALAIVRLIYPSDTTAPATLLLYLIVGGLVTLPYVTWRRKALGLDAPLAGDTAAR
jgi:bile acid:Na+ symporter, BASS family